MTATDIARSLRGDQGPRRLSLAGPTVGEEEVEAIREVLFSGVLTNGPATRRFESTFAERHGCEHGVAFANGTVALAALYLAHGIGAGDEVIVPSMTFISSATSVLHAGATPVFADVDPDTFNLDPADVMTRITLRTKAILAVHYGGQPADMDALRSVADDAGVLLLEDAAEAHGATYRSRPAGSLGDGAMFSFTPTKNITTCEGGVITTSDATLAERLRLLRNHGQVEPYRHGILGYNWRMSEMNAAMGCVQLGRLDGIIAKKRAHARLMADALDPIPGVTPPKAMPDREHVYMLYTLLIDEGRDAAMRHLEAHGVETRQYFPPVHRQPIFCETPRSLPVTESISQRMMSIPFHSNLSEDDLGWMASVIAQGQRRT